MVVISTHESVFLWPPKWHFHRSRVGTSEWTIKLQLLYMHLVTQAVLHRTQLTDSNLTIRGKPAMVYGTELGLPQGPDIIRVTAATGSAPWAILRFNIAIQACPSLCFARRSDELNSVVRQPILASQHNSLLPFYLNTSTSTGSFRCFTLSSQPDLTGSCTTEFLPFDFISSLIVASRTLLITSRLDYRL